MIMKSILEEAILEVIFLATISPSAATIDHPNAVQATRAP